MKILRISSLVLFLVSTIAYIGYRSYLAYNKDNKGPEISLNSSSITVSIAAKEKEYYDGVTAIDNKDGDVTESLLMESVSKFIGNGKRIITYAAFDSKNNITKQERELFYSDYTPPRFSISEPMRFPVGETENILQYVTAYDCIDGDLTEKLKYEYPDYNLGYSEGEYQIKLSVTNSAGDMAILPVNAEFYYPNKQLQDHTPIIKLNQYVTYIKSGQYLDAYSYLKGAQIGLDEYTFTKGQSTGMNKVIPLSNIKVTKNLNSNEPGVYEIEYSLTSEDGFTGSSKLIVVVE